MYKIIYILFSNYFFIVFSLVCFVNSCRFEGIIDSYMSFRYSCWHSVVCAFPVSPELGLRVGGEGA